VFQHHFRSDHLQADIRRQQLTPPLSGLRPVLGRSDLAELTDELLGGNGFAEEIALVSIAAVFFKESQLSFGLHALSDDLQT
jgi:hypothetical protein